MLMEKCNASLGSHYLERDSADGKNTKKARSRFEILSLKNTPHTVSYREFVENYKIVYPVVSKRCIKKLTNESKITRLVVIFISFC